MKVLSLFIVIVVFAMSNVSSQNATPTLNLNKLYYKALQGDVKIVLDKLDSIPNELLNKEQIDFKNKYFARFKLGTEKFNYKTADTTFITLLKLYQAYWRSFLLKKQTLVVADSNFANTISNYIYRYHNPAKISLDTIRNDFTGYVKNILGTRGFNVANGKTGELFDLLVWGKETEQVYKAKLPESKAKVKVVFMDSIKTMGWEEYATFGRYFPGGWATTDALFCVRSTYDLESENFKVSYIKHEGQHFQDYKQFPELSSADLEYRGKLVELSYADKTLYELIAFFIGNSSRERNNAHGFANNCVIRDLSIAIFGKEGVVDINEWKKIDRIKINSVSKGLLKKNTAQLRNVKD